MSSIDYVVSDRDFVSYRRGCDAIYQLYNNPKIIFSQYFFDKNIGPSLLLLKSLKNLCKYFLLIKLFLEN